MNIGKFQHVKFHKNCKHGGCVFLGDIGTVKMYYCRETKELVVRRDGMLGWICIAKQFPIYQHTIEDYPLWLCWLLAKSKNLIK